jgi:hypothetical protein
MNNLIEVGDIIITETCLSKYRYPITRVTKTLAMSIRKKDRYEYKFKRFISNNMGHPSQRYDNTKYTVERLNQS